MAYLAAIDRGSRTLSSDFEQISVHSSCLRDASHLEPSNAPFATNVRTLLGSREKVVFSRGVCCWITAERRRNSMQERRRSRVQLHETAVKSVTF